MNIIQKIWWLLKPFHRDFYGIFAITLVFEIIRMGGPYLFGRILDLMIQSKGLITVETALVVVGGLAGVRLISMLLDYATDVVIARTLWKSGQHVSTVTFNKLLELSMDYHEKVNTGAKINILNRGTDKLDELLSAFTWDFQPIVLQLLVTIVLITLTSWRIGLIFSLSVIPFVLITIKISQSTRKLREKRYDAYEDSSSVIGDTISNITVVKAFAQEPREQRSFESIIEFITKISAREFYKFLLSSFGRNLAVEVFYISLLVMGIFEIRAGALTVGNLVFLISLVERAYSHFYRIGRIYERAIDASEPVNRIVELLHKTPTVRNTIEPGEEWEVKGQISFKHVTFAYKKKRVLKNVSFTIPAGSFTALVGKSGSGKSTIAKLLSRYYDPTRGGIIIDGKYDLRDLELDSFRKQTAVVFQDSPVPNRRIWEVISYAAGKKSFASVKNQVTNAAKLAHAHEFILELDEGYQTLIGERGVKLSGGQRQRLAIARALFAEPKILIMDEPTSHLDTVSEAMIQQALNEISQTRSMTKIIIAHRLSTVQHADQILVMEKGKLVEKGTHSQLLRKGGVYATIVHQSELKG